MLISCRDIFIDSSCMSSGPSHVCKLEVLKQFYLDKKGYKKGKKRYELSSIYSDFPPFCIYRDIKNLFN